jgi:unsaturated rhamnogalacturonyl hydrolase
MNKTSARQLDLLVDGLVKVLYGKDIEYGTGKPSAELPPEQRHPYWEWPQGVGLFGLWSLFAQTEDHRYLEIIKRYYDEQIALGLPSKNVNTMAPILALSYLAEYTNDTTYLNICKEWADWAMHSMDRTQEGGMQHHTSEETNKDELWDDTLMMTVLPLANMGRILGNQEYMDEAIYQFLLHVEHLANPRTGLWYHGYTFQGHHNFTEAYWGRGNGWISVVIPLFLEMVPMGKGTRRYLETVFLRQAEALATMQDPGGMWHTLLDRDDSYLEASATAAFGFGMLRGVRMGILDARFEQVARKALDPIVDAIDRDGIVGQVSHGTPMGKESQDFYKNIPLYPTCYGQALAMLFLMEAGRK